MPAVTENKTPYYDTDLIVKLKSEMRKIKKGWKEVCSDTGEFDVDSYVSGSQKCFTDEEKMKVGGYKVLILLDHSASIRQYNRIYKKACITLCEALSALGIQFAVYGFSQPMRMVSIGLIKSFKEKWTRINAKRLASFEIAGGTPLNVVYEELSKVVDRTGKLIFITLTDGEPNLKKTTMKQIKKLKKKCKMVAIGLGENMEKVVALTKNLKNLEYDECVALDNIKKLPEKVFKLILCVV